MRAQSSRIGPSHCTQCGAELRPWMFRFCSEACYGAERSERLAARLWPTLDRSGGCWIWTGPRIPAGYGVLCFESHRSYAHRVAWELTNGPIPDGMVIRHKCDNPPCCNPDHLEVGTQLDNVQDAIRRGRLRPIRPLRLDTLPVEGRARGEDNGSAVLTEDDVRTIRRLYATHTISQTALGEQFGVHTSTISLIVTRQHWKHVE